MRVTPIYFTSDPERMRRFCEVLGLSTYLRADRGGWVEMRGSGGFVGLHEATAERAGQSGLGFETDEPLEDLRDRLVAAGFDDAHIIDEAWGRVLWVDDPDGHGLWVQEARTDLYGYHLVDGQTGA